MNNPIVDTPKKPIMSEMDTLSDKLHQMREGLTLLEADLTPVLTDPVMTGTGEFDDAVADSYLCQKILNECRAVESMLDKLNDIRNRLEV
jgi:hypothetical protein